MTVHELATGASRSINVTNFSRAARFRRQKPASGLQGVPAVAAKFPHAQAVLDAICDLRARDDAYGPGDGYFGQPLRPLYRELPGLSAGEILETVAHLLAVGRLRGSRHNPGLVWVTNEGWLRWTSWDARNQYLLRHEEAGD